MLNYQRASSIYRLDFPLGVPPWQNGNPQLSDHGETAAGCTFLKGAEGGTARKHLGSVRAAQGNPRTFCGAFHGKMMGN